MTSYRTTSIGMRTPASRRRPFTGELPDYYAKQRQLIRIAQLQERATSTPSEFNPAESIAAARAKLAEMGIATEAGA